MNEEEVRNLLFLIRAQIVQEKKAMRQEIQDLEKEKYEPLIEQAKKVKEEIQEEVHLKYKERLSSIYQELKKATELEDSFKIKAAKELWYKEGTTVWLWMHPSCWGTYDGLKKTNKTGTVVIYDGTQKLSQINKYRLPDIGDIIVMENKKDGSMGLKYVFISRYGRLNSNASNWCCEGDTPTDNIETRKKSLVEQQ